MSVNIFDPLNIIINNRNNNYISNKIPDTENLTIFINLKAYRKSVSNIIFNAKGYVDINTISDLDINMMGFDPNKKKYTTNWSDNTILKDDNYDGFGITNIDINTNSSYIPEVTIEFVDIRGMNFLNKGKESPYSVLYDFPPPIFELTIKGYYGKPLKYTLHLTKQNTKFDSNTGNYYITVNLIANVFAPLTDVLFKYAEIISLMYNNENGIDLDVNDEPKSIYELTYRLKNLYENIESNVKKSTEVKKYHNNKDIISHHLNFIQILNKKLFVNEQKYRPNINFYLGINNGNGYEYRKINNVNVFSNYCKKENFSVDARLLIINENTNLINLNKEIKENIINENVRVNDGDIIYRNIDAIDIREYNKYNIIFNNALDITKAYKKVHNEYYQLLNQQRELQDKINKKIENKVEKNLGFRPTVRNIIKIICDDVDKMFKILNEVKNKAEIHHNQNFKKIIGMDNIYKDVKNTNKINAFPLFIEKKQINNKCNETESRVYPKNSIFKKYPFPETNFVDDFINTFLQIKRDEIPLNIRMSEDGQGNVLWIPINPLDSNIDMETYSSPYINYPNKGIYTINNIIKILLERFLILSQFSFYKSFYIDKDLNLIKLYSESEAINLSISLTETKIIDEFIKLNYSDLSEILKNINININETKEIITTSNRKYVINKENSDYDGILILNYDEISERDKIGNSPIDVFIQNNKPNWFVKFFKDELDPKYSTNNILIVPDNQYEINQYTTRFANWYRRSYLSIGLRPSPTSNLRYIIDSIRANTDILNSGLSDSLLLLSVSSIFGEINYVDISKSAIYDVPYFFILFIGGIFYNEYEDIKNNSDIIFNNGESNYSYKIIPIVDKIKTYLSDNDIQKFILEFEYVLQNTYLLRSLKELNYLTDEDYLKLLDDPDNIYNNDIINILNERKYLVVNSEYVWSNKNIETYETYQELIEDQQKKNIVDRFFRNFLSELKSELKIKKRDFQEEEKEFNESINDDDIKTQTYYSIKNIVDKWVRGYETNGYPFINENEKLIDKFVFVDRAMNDIGDACIINAESIIEMENDININVFTVISRLLSKNNFEFFPLQNFMNFEGNQWEESFQIYNTINSNVTTTPAFVCMYIGGTSSTLNTNNNYIDDGLNNLENSIDFNNNCSEDYGISDNNSINNNVNYGNVNAFIVNYGIQNQSIFQNIEIDSEEYPETNESLAILSKLAKDESNSTPVPKGQNLYNLYENRAYSAKITMMGNAMIQPTNYFELRNIPLFSGAYIVLNVQHNITPNYMSTTFSGVRILKYPNPIVNSFAQSIGMLMGINSDINDEILNDENNNMEEEIDNYNSEYLPDEAKYNSMHPNNDETLKI